MRYALLLVFEYCGETYPRRITGAHHDLETMYALCTVLLNIPPHNITAVTDCSKVDRVKRCNLIRLDQPDEENVCAHIAQFIENTCRGIEIIEKSNEIENNEVFLYISGHGGNLNSIRQQGILLTERFSNERRYLISSEIFNIFFGICPIDDKGVMSVKTYNQNGEVTNLRVQLQKPRLIASPDKPNRSSYYTNRGLPISTRLLTIIDACHSGYLTYFPYEYSLKENRMIDSINYQNDAGELPYCVTISSCRYNEISRSDPCGSFVTRIIWIRLKDVKGPLTIGQLSELLLKNNVYNMVISSTSNSIDEDVPFFSPLYNEEEESKISIPIRKIK